MLVTKNMKLKKLDTLNGINILGLSINKTGARQFNEVDLYLANPKLFPLDKSIQLEYRSVSFDRWNYIKNNGVDVEPTNAVIYCDCLAKASEYGKWPKVIMGFDRKYLDKTYREVDSSIDDMELQSLLNKFPTKEQSKNGSKFWLSRLSKEDRRRTTAYEVNYAKWIPGEPWDALKLIILARQDDRDWII